MTQKFGKIVLALALLLSGMIDQAAYAVNKNLQRFLDEEPQVAAHGLTDADIQELRRQCCCASSICSGVLSNAVVGPQGSIFFDTVSGEIFFSNGTVLLPIAFGAPAPTLITVDQTATPNGFNVFNTIQAAIDSLGNKKITNTTIKINATGNQPTTYTENVELDSMVVTNGNDLKLIGDTRQLVGVGIAHNSFWNPNPTPTTPVGGGIGSNAVMSAAGNTLTVTNSGAGVNPDFTGAGNPAEAIVPGDRVIIRDNAGVNTVYTVASVTPTTLTFTAPIIGTIGGATAVGSAMTIFPNVIITNATTNTSVVTNNVYATFQGLTIQSDTVTTMDVGSWSGSYLTNVLLTGLGAFLTSIDNVSTNASVGNVVLAPAVLQTTTFLGISLMNTDPASFRPVVAGGGSQWNLLNSLFSGGNEVIFSQFQALIRLNFSKVLSVSGIGINTPNSSVLVVSQPVDVMALAGTGVQIQKGSKLLMLTIGALNIRGAPATGVDIRDSELNGGAAFPLSFSTTAATFTGIRLRDGKSKAITAIGTYNAPNTGAASFIARVDQGSSLEIAGVTGPITIGATSQGFQILNDSSLIWTAGSLASAVATTGTLFDVQRDSSIVVVPGAHAFTNFAKFFNIIDNSNATVFNTITTSPAVSVSHYTADNFSHIICNNCVAINDLVVGPNNITNGSGIRRIASATVFASADASSQSL